MDKLILAFALALAALPAAAQRETVQVTGSGRASVAVDRVVFTVGVETFAETVDAAIRQNNERVASTIAALKAAGAREEGLQTARFSIVPQQDERAGAVPRIVGYRVSNSITVHTGEVDRAGRLLQAAVEAGVNTASSLRLDVADPSKGRDEALRAAFADALAQAQVLAQAAGRRLGRALRIAQGGRDAPPQPYSRAMALSAESVGEVPVTPGTREVIHSVSVTFELR